MIVFFVGAICDLERHGDVLPSDVLARYTYTRNVRDRSITACKDEFRRNPRSHSRGVFTFFTNVRV